jgi:hypothetical protein
MKKEKWKSYVIKVKLLLEPVAVRLETIFICVHNFDFGR